MQLCLYPRTDAGLAFALKGGDGSVLLESERFPDQESCARAIRRTLEALTDRERYHVTPAEGSFVLSLEPGAAPTAAEGADGSAVCRSPLLPSAEAAHALRDQVHAWAAAQDAYEIVSADQHVVAVVSLRAVESAGQSAQEGADADAPAPVAAAPKVEPADEPRSDTTPTQRQRYRSDLDEAKGAPGLTLWRDPDDKLHYFVFRDGDGGLLLYSQGYRGRDSRDNGVRSLLRNAADPTRYEVRRSGSRFYFVLRAANYQELARSRWFTQREAASAAIATCHERLPGLAPTDGPPAAESGTTAPPAPVPTPPVAAEPPPVTPSPAPAPTVATSSPPEPGPAPAEERPVATESSRGRGRRAGAVLLTLAGAGTVLLGLLILNKNKDRRSLLRGVAARLLRRPTVPPPEPPPTEE